jgi:single-strand DNA-binding protein
MALSVNKVTLLGNVGKDLDYKVTPSGIPLCKFSIATSESFKNKNDQWEERTEWHNLECWRGIAETANKHLKKGTKVYIEGKLRTDSYEKDGSTRYSTKVVITELVLIDKSNNQNQNQNQPQQNEPRPPQFGENVMTVDMESEGFDDVPF